MQPRQDRYVLFQALYNGMITIASVLLFPLFIYWLLTTSKRRFTFRQRMGWCRYPWQRPVTGQGPGLRCIWVHALSVGEAHAAQPLVARLRSLHPGRRICFTTSTHTGFQTAQRLFDCIEGIDLAYFPYDLIGAVRRVASKINPAMVILTETDIWPNFLMEMRRRKVPVHLINLRLSQNSWHRFSRFKRFSGALFNVFDKIAVQNPQDLKRLHSLGVPSGKVAVTGNIKFDNVTPAAEAASAQAWKTRLGIPSVRAVIVAGSTHEGEEDVLIQVMKSLGSEGRRPVLVLAPRDPQRSPQLKRICTDQGLACSLMSDLSEAIPSAGGADVVLIDAIGVLKSLYSIADVVFIGGSLVSCGGHNPLEPAELGKPILFGPDMRDFELIAELLTTSGGALRATGVADMLVTIRQLLSDPESAAQMGHRALTVFRSQQGAVDRTLKFLGLGDARDLHEKA